jgi:hypothetical protein
MPRRKKEKQGRKRKVIVSQVGNYNKVQPQIQIAITGHQEQQPPESPKREPTNFA